MRIGGALLVIIGVLLVTGAVERPDGRHCGSGSTASPRRSGELHGRLRRGPPRDVHGPERGRAGRPERPGGPVEHGPVGLAAAHLDAHRAAAAPPARRRRRTRLAGARSGRRPGAGRASSRRSTLARAVVRAAVAVRGLPRPGSPRSTCCCSSRSPAAWCRAAGRTGRRRGHGRPAAPRTSSGCRCRRAATTDAVPREVLDGAPGGVLRRRRFRVDVGIDGAVAAEKGYLRETGNLVFHLVAAVAAGRGGRGQPVRLPGQRARWPRGGASPTPCRRTTRVRPGTARSTRLARAVHRDARRPHRALPARAVSSAARRATSGPR